MTNSPPVAVTVVGNDRPGIVAAVTRALFDLGCNLEDATSTILRGHFSMMLVVRPPETTDAQALDEALRRVGEPLGLLVSARPVDEADARPGAPTHMVSVYGADRPGIVFRVAEVLASSGSNITDLTSRLIGSDDQPVYAVMMEVALEDESSTGAALERLRDDLGLDVSLRPLEADLL
ncbi:MAG: ACT domain-containing protein [Actinomycetota bacterium]|nr:ACT domain-containing protein [Actinomycetota bacterium]